MYVYKITNIINNKCYIGQTTKSILECWKRHVNNAVTNRLDTHLSRAIRKYGTNNFTIEEIDKATSQEELTKKEYYWIKKLNACKEGYNETDSPYKSGGNTYKTKNDTEMQIIKEKIRESKLGAKNSNATSIKCKNIKTLQEYHFGSMRDAEIFFGESNHTFISKRVRGLIKKIYKQEWIFAYEEQEYPDYVFVAHHYKAKKIQVVDLKNQEEYNFENFISAERYLNLPKSSISKKFNRIKEKQFILYDKYRITILN